MSVPPPSCTDISSSTGSAATSVRSTTLVSNTTSRSRYEGRPARMPAITALWMTEPAIDPLWSTTSTTSHGMRRVLLEEQRPLDHEPHRLGIPVPQVGAHGAARVEVRGDRERAVPVLAEPAGERLAHLALQPLAKVVDDGAHDPAYLMQHVRVEAALEGKERLQQCFAGLDAGEHLRVADQLGQSVTVEGVAFDDLD